MNITLVSYPTLTDFTDKETLDRIENKYTKLPPLGILVVASIFKKEGANVNISDSNFFYSKHIKKGYTIRSFSRKYAEFLAISRSDIYGFSTICSSYYITIDIAKQLKKILPDTTIVFGGPQASSTAGITLKEYPFIDYVFCGEVENSIREFLKSKFTDFEKVPGLCWRNENKIIKNPESICLSIDTLEYPAYDLWHMNKKMEEISLEAGRGCPFDCKFCSTNQFFSRKFRLKSPERLVDEMLYFHSLFKTRHFNFIHDNIFHNVKQVERFADVWSEKLGNTDLTWSGSIRADLVDNKIVSLLSKTNCIGLFLGIESGSQEIQRIINKNINLDKVQNCMVLLHENNIRTTESFIIGYPEENKKDISDTFELYLGFLTKKKSEPQLGLLSPLTGTKYFNEYRDLIFFDENISCMAHQGAKLTRRYTKQVQGNKELYSAHFAIPTANIQREYLAEAVMFIRYTQHSFRYLLIIAAMAFGGLTRVIDLWIMYKRKKSRSDKFDYYTVYQFQKNFINFCKNIKTKADFDKGYESMYDYFISLYTINRHEYKKLFKSPFYNEGMLRLTGDEYLLLNAIVKTVPYSFKEITTLIDKGKPFNEIIPMESRVIVYRKADQIVIEELSPLASKIVEKFSVKNKINSMADLFIKNYADLIPEEVKNKKAAVYYSVKKLIEKNIIIKNAG